MADLRLLIEVLTKGDNNLRTLDRDLKRTGDEAEKTGSKIGGMGKAIGAFATGFVAFKAVEFLADATNAAAEFNDTVSASGVIFSEDATPALEEWADSAAEAFGASKQQALDAANTFAVFGKSAGLAGDDLLDFSTDLTELAGDLASFRGGTTEDAITAIGAALRGESEPIRRYGVLLDDATLKQRALTEGIIDTIDGALTPQERTLAAQAEIFAQTTDAQGDFARTSDEMANTQRTLGAELENVNIEIGQKLIPIMLELANFASDVLIPALTGVTDAMEFIGDATQWIRDGLDFLTGSIGDTEKSFGDVNPTLGKTKDRLDGVGSGADSLRTNLRELGDTSEKEWGRIAAEPANQMSAAADSIRDAAFQQQVEYAKGLLQGQNEPLVQMEALQQLQEESMSVTAEIARLKGQLTSQELGRGLSSAIPVVRAQAEAARLAIVSQLASLGVDAYSWGTGISYSLAAGIVNSLGVVHDASRSLAQGVASQVRIESEPPDPNSPLAGITRWGYNIARTLQEGMERGVGLVTTGSATLAAAITPGTLQGVSGALSGTEATAGAGGYHTHIHLTYSGEMPDSPEDLTRLLQEVAPFIDGRLRVTD
jgi:hypothetical protein